MLHSSANRRSGKTGVALLFPWGGFILFPVILFGLIFFLYTDRNDFEEDFNDRQADAISIAYLKQMVRSKPEDWRLVYRLSSQLQATGQFIDAWLYLGNYDDSHLDNTQKTQRLALMAQVAGSRSFAESDPALRAFWVDRAQQILSEHDWQKAPAAILHQLAKLTLAMEDPGTAVDLFQLLALTDNAGSYQWQLQAAGWSQASEKAKQSGDYFLRAAGYTTNTTDKIKAISRAVDAYIAQGQHAAALSSIILVVELDRQQTENLIKVIQLSLQNGKTTLAKHYLKRVLQLDLSINELEEVYLLSLQTGVIEDGLIAAERLHRFDPDNVAYRKQLATLYEWNNQPVKALDHWIWLSINTNDVKATEKASKLASGVFDSQKLRDLLVYTARQRALTQEELDELVGSWEDLGQPDRAEAFLREYLSKKSDDEVAWHLLARALDNQQKLPELINVWTEIYRRFSLDDQALLNYAYALQNAGSLNEAVELLLSEADSFDAPDMNDSGKEFWRLLADVAWYADNDEAIVMALERSMVLEPDNTAHIDRYLSLASILSARQRLVVARRSFETFGEIRYGMVVLEAAAQENEWKLFDKTLMQLRRIPGIASQCQYFNYLGMSHERQGAISQAGKAYRKSIQCAGPENYLIASYIYFLINVGQKTELKESLNKWQKQAISSPQLWQVFAAGWSALSATRKSIGWYRKAMDYQPENLLVQLAYADVLTQSNFHTAAQRTRRQVLRKLRDSDREVSIFDSQWRPYLLPVNTWLNGLSNSIELAISRTDQTPDVWLSTFTSLLIEEGDIHAATEWVNQAREQNLTVPLYHQLVVALQGDRESLQPLLAQLPEGAEKSEALSMSGMDGEALNTSLGQLGVAVSDNTHYQLLGQSTQLSVAAPSGWRIRTPLSSDSTLSTNGVDFTLAQRYDEWHLQLDSSTRTVTDQSALVRKSPQSWNDLSLQSTFFDRDGYWRGRLDIAQRTGSPRVGGRLSRYHVFDNRWAASLSLGLQETVDTSSLLNAFAKRDLLGFGLEWRISPRNLLYSGVALQKLSDAYEDENIGQGAIGQLFWRHQLTAHYPEWNVTAGIDWQTYSLPSELGTDFASYLEEGSTPASILNEEYQRYYLNSRWQHGEPGALNARVPSPRWFFGVGLGYQQKPQGAFGYTLEAGIGWRVFGDDELTLMSFYSDSASLNEGGRGYQLTMSYQHRFGR